MKIATFHAFSMNTNYLTLEQSEKTIMAHVQFGDSQFVIGCVNAFAQSRSTLKEEVVIG